MGEKRSVLVGVHDYRRPGSNDGFGPETPFRNNSIQSALQWGRQQLIRSSTGTPVLDAQLLLAAVLQVAQTTLLSHPAHRLSTELWGRFQQLIARRLAGEPVAYLLGRCEFWSLPLQINPACLIPRPETELIVEAILAHYAPETTIRVADLGTGSGAIALALASERPHWQIVATDFSKQALQIAQLNAKTLGLTQIQFRQGSWCTALKDCMPFHSIVSNPPYLRQHDKHLDSLRHEPSIALTAGTNGLEALQQIIQQTRHYLLVDGYLWLEQGYDQAAKVAQLLIQHDYSEIKQYPDLNNILRVSRGKIKRIAPCAGF